MKKFRFLLVFCCLVLGLTACGGQASESALVEAGQDIVVVMDEMIRTDEYGTILWSDQLTDVRDEVKAGDYASPVAVYAVTAPSTQEMLRLMNAYDDKLWNGLSDTLKEQLEQRITFANVLSIINGKAGTDAVAFSSLYIASRQDDALRVEAPITLLYVFGEGTPVAVSFTEYGGVQGQFLFLEDTSETAISTALEAYGCTARKVK